MKGRGRKQEGNPSRPVRKRRTRTRQVEKEREKEEETQRQQVDDIKFNKKVMSNLEKSGAVNYLLAKMFTQLSIFANQRQRKKYLISSDYKSFIKPKKNTVIDDDYSDDNSDNAQERNKIRHLIASRIVYEYLIDHKLELTCYALQNETRKDKAFSSNTPASFSPLQLDLVEEEDENDKQENHIIKQIIVANKKTGLLKPPVRRRKEDDEIMFNVPKKKGTHLRRKGSLNSDFSLASINSSLTKDDEMLDAHSSSEHDEEEEDETENIESNKEILDDEYSHSHSYQEPVSPPKSPIKRKPAPPLPSTTSPKRNNQSSIKPAPPLKTTTPSKLNNSIDLSSGNELQNSDSSSNIEMDDNDSLSNVKIYKPQDSIHAKNEIDSMDISIYSGDIHLDFNPIAKSASSQAAEEIPAANQNNLSKDDSLNESSGSEHELEADDDYNSGKDYQ